MPGICFKNQWPGRGMGRDDTKCTYMLIVEAG